MGEEKIRRGGPKPLPEDEKRTIYVSACFNRRELNKLDALCKVANMRRGQLLREGVLNFGENIGGKSVPALNAKAWVELSRAASNLNQIAKRLNREEMLGIVKIQEVLKEFRMWLIGAKNESQD
jgi:hypothetical protein